MFDVLLITCCLSTITQKSRINPGVNINPGAESCRAGDFGKQKEFSHTANNKQGDLFPTNY